MKLFRLSLSRIWCSIIYHRMTFIIFFLGAMLSSFVFIYFYGNSMQQDIAETENRIEYRTYMVNFPENVPITDAHIHLLDSYGIKDVQVGCSVTLSDSLMAKLPQGSVPRLYALLNNGNNFSEEEGVQDMTEEQLSQTGLLVDKSYGADLTQIEVNGIDFPVIGRREHTGGMLISSIQTYFQFFNNVDYLMYITTDILSERQQKEVVQKLKDTFPNMSSYLAPEFFSNSDREEQHSIQLHAGLMYVVSLLSFLFLFQYLQEKNRNENTIYQIVGCKHSVLFSIILLEILILATATCLITCFIHAALYDDIFCKLNMTETYIAYSIADYLTILCATVGMATAVSLPFFITCLKNTPINLKNKFEEGV